MAEHQETVVPLLLIFSNEVSSFPKWAKSGKGRSFGGNSEREAAKVMGLIIKIHGHIMNSNQKHAYY